MGRIDVDDGVDACEAFHDGLGQNPNTRFGLPGNGEGYAIDAEAVRPFGPGTPLDGGAEGEGGPPGRESVDQGVCRR